MCLFCVLKKFYSRAVLDVLTRQEAFTTLRLYLQRSVLFSQLEFLKLWKGLFYCMWLTSNVKPQQALAEDFATLVTDVLSEHNVLPFVEAFWITMSRQWMDIDALRMDKYLRLMRLIFRASLRFLGTHKFATVLIEAHNNIIHRIPLNIEDRKLPNGLRFHVLDIFVDELEVLKEAAGSEMDSKVVHDLLGPVAQIKDKGLDKSVRKRAAEALSDGRLVDLGVSKNANEQFPGVYQWNGEDEDDFNGFDD